jgi:septal ring factor EnvC (AmiA/AmiB activator)
MTNELSKSDKKTHRLIIAEWASLVSLLLACFVFLLYRNEKQSDRIDQLNAQYQEQFAKQTERSDHLYQMFIDLIKETRG